MEGRLAPVETAVLPGFEAATSLDEVRQLERSSRDRYNGCEGNEGVYPLLTTITSRSSCLR